MIRIEKAVIKRRIRELGYTHIGVAKRANISTHTLHGMLSGRYGTPRPFTRKMLAKVLEVGEEVIFPVVGASEEEAS